MEKVELMYENFVGGCSISQKISEENNQYKELDNNSKSIENKLLEGLTADQKVLLIKYSDILVALSAIEAKTCYIQGFKDGVSLK